MGAVRKLLLEAQWFATSGGKDAAIADLGYRPVRYYQRLVQLISTRAAQAYDPVTVNRLRRRANPKQRA